MSEENKTSKFDPEKHVIIATAGSGTSPGGIYIEPRDPDKKKEERQRRREQEREQNRSRNSRERSR